MYVCVCVCVGVGMGGGGCRGGGEGGVVGVSLYIREDVLIWGWLGA